MGSGSGKIEKKIFSSYSIYEKMDVTFAKKKIIMKSLKKYLPDGKCFAPNDFPII